MKKVYISGKISGLPREQYMTMFGIAEQMIRKKGYEVVNPTRFFMCKYEWVYRLLGYRLTLLYDLWRLMQCDLIYKLPGWQQSRGANIESCVAYHFDVWPLSSKVREIVDARMNRFIENKRKPHTDIPSEQ